MNLLTVLMLWSISFKCHINSSAMHRQPAGTSFSHLFFFPLSFTQMFPMMFIQSDLIRCVCMCVCECVVTGGSGQSSDSICCQINAEWTTNDKWNQKLQFLNSKHSEGIANCIYDMVTYALEAQLSITSLGHV